MSEFGEYILKFLNDLNWNKLVEIGVGYNFETLNYLINHTNSNKKFLIIDKNLNCLKKLKDSSMDNRVKILNKRINDKTTLNNEFDLIYSIRPNPELIKHLKNIADNNSTPLLIRPFKSDEYRKNLELVNYKGLPILRYKNKYY